MAHLQVEQLSIGFGGLKAVNDVSFAVEEGAIHGLIGPNGAGKTTIFNCVSGVYKPNHGSIRFAGHDLTLLKPHQVAQCGIARTFQNIELFRNMTVWTTCSWGSIRICGAAFLPVRWPCRGDSAKPKSRTRVRQIMQFLGLEEVQRYLAASLPFRHQKLLELAGRWPWSPSCCCWTNRRLARTLETAALRLLIEDIGGA